MKSLLVSGVIIAFVAVTASFSARAQTNAVPATPQPNERLCWSFAEAQQPLEDSFEEFIAGVGRGNGIFTFYELRTPDTMRLELLGFGVYAASAGDEIILHLELFSPEAEPQHIRYIVLVNEQQMPVSIGDNEQLFLDVQLIPREITRYDFPLPRLDDGVYDIVIVALTDFDSRPEPIGRPGESSHRMTLVVGQPSDITLPYRHFPEQGTLPAVPQTLSLTFGESLVQWSYPEPAYALAAGHPLQFNVLTGYAGQSDFGNHLPDPDLSRFALIAFFDYVQVAPFAGQDVLYGEVSRNTAYARIPVVFPVEGVGTHEILVVRINNPRIPVCVLQGPEGGYWLPFDANHVRAALEVVETDD